MLPLEPHADRPVRAAVEGQRHRHVGVGIRLQRRPLLGRDGERELRDDVVAEDALRQIAGGRDGLGRHGEVLERGRAGG